MTPSPIPNEWVDAYFADHERLTSTDRTRRLEPRDDRLTEWLHNALARSGLAELEGTWEAVLMLVRRAPNDEALAFVAAGPLEDFIRRFGAPFADRLVATTRDDPRFREAMRSVWGWEGVSGDLRERLFPLLERSSDDPLHGSTEG